jgi:hypothetical protein
MVATFATLHHQWSASEGARQEDDLCVPQGREELRLDLGVKLVEQLHPKNIK